MNKRKTTSIALAAAVAISTVQLAYPANVFANEQVKESKIENLKEVKNNNKLEQEGLKNTEKISGEDLQDIINNSPNGTEDNPIEIILNDSIVGITKEIEIPSGKHIKLIGAKLGISIELSESVSLPKGVFVYKDKGNSTMTIENLTLDAHGKSRLIYVGTNNKLILNNSILKNGNISGKGGAIYTLADTTIIMNGGCIQDNISSSYGAGIFGWANNINIIINDGEIKNNQSGNYGAAITLLGNRSNLKLNNALIQNNKPSGSHASEIFVGGGAQIHISGNTVIKNNNGGKNIHFNDDSSKIHLMNKFIGEINLKESNLLGKKDKAYIFASEKYEMTEEDASYFNKYLLDDEMLNVEEVDLNGEKVTALVLRNAANVTFNPNGGKYPDGITSKIQKVVKNDGGDTDPKTTLLKNTFTKEGCVFLGWATEKDGEVVYKDGEKISTSEDKELFAKWGKVVATIEGVEYADLQTAIDNAKGKTIEIKDDIILKEPINIKEDDININFDNKKITMENSNSESDLIKIVGGKRINIEKANFALSGGRAIVASDGAEITVKESNFSTTNKDTTKSAISVEDATLKIEGNVNSKIEGEEETFPLVELNNESKIELEENSSINGHELPNIGETTSGNSNDIIGNNTELEDILEHITVENLVEATSTNSIKIKKWTGVSDKNFYGIVKKANVTTRNLSAKSQIEPIGGWKDVSNIESVTFDGLSSGTDYEIYVAADVNGSNAMKIASVKTESNTSSGGGGSSTPSIPSKPSKPTYTHEKIEGLDRYETAAKIADKLGSYDNVVLVNAESSMSDGLAASGLAGKENGAILLTKKDSIPKTTMDRLKKVKKVYIIGGENAISQKVSDEITKNVPNVKVERLGGKTRVETSELVAKKLGNYNKAFVVNGFKGESDAMSASAVAAKNGAPILLTNGKTSTHAKKAGVEYYVIGGDTVVDKSIATKYNAEVLAGKDRYATNREVINEFYSGRDKVYIANGDKLVDALTASPLAKKDGIVLVNKKSDKSILKGKDTVQVGGMDFEIDFE